LARLAAEVRKRGGGEHLSFEKEKYRKKEKIFKIYIPEKKGRIKKYTV